MRMKLSLMNFSSKLPKCPQYFCKILNYPCRSQLFFCSLNTFFFSSTSRTFSRYCYQLLSRCRVAAPLFKPVSFSSPYYHIYVGDIYKHVLPLPLYSLIYIDINMSKLSFIYVGLNDETSLNNIYMLNDIYVIYQVE